MGHTIRIAMAMEHTNRTAMGTEQPLMDGTTEQPLIKTAAIDRGLDTGMRTNRGLGTDHPRIRTSSRGGHAETSAWTSKDCAVRIVSVARNQSRAEGRIRSAMTGELPKYKV